MISLHVSAFASFLRQLNLGQAMPYVGELIVQFH
jgi:hypothetical protein